MFDTVDDGTATQDLIDLTLINRARLAINELLEPLILDPFDVAAMQELARTQQRLVPDVQRAIQRRGRGPR